MRLLLFLLSWVLVAFGQPAWIPAFAPIAACIGYALFWMSLRAWEGALSRFWIATLWFSFVQLIQLSWMSSVSYMGPLFLLVYLGVVFAIGLQFGLLSWAVQRDSSPRHWAGLAGLWVLLEWLRLFPFTGFSWNPVGLAWTASIPALQAASLFGIYGLSFWVIFVNLAVLHAWDSYFHSQVNRKRSLYLAGACAALPFLFGAFHLSTASKEERRLSALLVQPFLYPHERDLDPYQSPDWVPPLTQWERILYLTKQDRPVDLIVFPEAVVPFPAFQPSYPFASVKEIWQRAFGEEAIRDFPPFGDRTSVNTREGWVVSNAFLMQAIANRYHSEVIAGMDDADSDGEYVNAAFHFMPNVSRISRTEKRILVPVAEYIPLQRWRWLTKFIAEKYGISSSFKPGREGKIFSGQANWGVSICYEETYGETIRELFKQGAHVFINLSNDGWYPRSRLPQQHFDHGIVRAVENGLPALRACSTGVTGGVDCFGRVLQILSNQESGALWMEVPLATTRTFYSFWGNGAILVLSTCFFFLLCIKRKEPLARNE